IEDVKLGVDEGVLGRKMGMIFSPDFNDSTVELNNVDYKLIKEGNPSQQKEPFVPGKRYVKKTNKVFEFDYGYCVTTHKSQGSQWNKVLLFEESLNREMHARWLYTAITRAVQKIVIVKQY
ncbi:MAG: ATP-binding domain-containing protein, partial [Cellulosilyticaceae bacterium]